MLSRDNHLIKVKPNRLPNLELIKSTVWMCRHVWNLLSSAVRSFESTVGVNAAMRVSSVYGVALNLESLPPPTSVHTMSLSSILPIHTHTGRQTRVLTAEDEGQGQMGPQKDICELMASPKQAQQAWMQQ